MTDIGYAFGRQVFTADAQDCLAHLKRHPAEHAMHDDVIELAKAFVDVCQAHGVQLQVFTAQILHNLPALLNLRRR
ncbi:DUF1826 domain-containing protein [Paralcaligenes sp. KSB-10]|nr:DUF1826 domain-containing protein [Paralcaligenes sp. KSB-10]UHL66230.1 DUF1826 domain-containing protein [Paralcaligenes sp. KSB-10]